MKGPAWPIAPPRNQAPLHSLTAAAEEPQDEVGTRWMQGFEFAPRDIIAVEGYPGIWCDDQEDKPLKPDDTPPPLVVHMPINLVTSYACPYGYSEDERIAFVKSQLAIGETKALERELWTGATAAVAGYENMSLITPNAGVVDETAIVNPTYDPDTDTPADAVAVDLITGLSLLGQALADFGNGQRGMIHVTPFVGELAVNGGLWNEKNGQLLTKARGDIIVVGSGYPGTGPGGNTPTASKVWLHATGPVIVRFGEVEILPRKGEFVHAFTRGSNLQITHRAERVATAYWDGLNHHSVLVDLAASWLIGGAGE